MRRYSKPLTAKEDFINDMIKDAIKHTPNFDIGRISNGDYTFGEYQNFLTSQGLLGRFIKFTIKKEIPFEGSMGNGKSAINGGSSSAPIEEDLPFAELASDAEVAEIERKYNLGE